MRIPAVLFLTIVLEYVPVASTCTVCVVEDCLLVYFHLIHAAKLVSRMAYHLTSF